MALKSSSIKSTKIKFDTENSTKMKESMVSEEIPKKNKHIKFDNDDDDDGNVADDANNITSNGGGSDSGGGKNKKHTEKKHSSKKSEKNRKNAMDIGTHWYQVVSSFFFLIQKVFIKILNRMPYLFSVC